VEVRNVDVVAVRNVDVVAVVAVVPVVAVVAVVPVVAVWNVEVVAVWRVPSTAASSPLCRRLDLLVLILYKCRVRRLLIQDIFWQLMRVQVSDMLEI
jgi:hypothetical protein